MLMLRLINFLLLLIVSTLIVYLVIKRKDIMTKEQVHADEAIKLMDDVPRLTHVVVPFHAKQIDRIGDFFNLWTKYPPCVDSDTLSEPFGVRMKYNPPLARSIELVFFIGSMNDTSAEEETVLTFYNRLPESVKGCFSSKVVTTGHRFNKTDNGYLLGAKGMFERFLNGDLGATQNPFHYAFYMEPDVRPIRPGWLTIVDAHCRWPSPKFWIKGSQFRGNPLPRHCKNIVTKLHINGNAIYNLRDPDFRKHYYEMVLPFLKRKGHKTWQLAYDLFFMTNVLENEEDYPVYQKHLHKFVLSDFIQNRWHINYTIAEVLEESESTYLVHGGTQIVE
jgi:hypothetical protein